MMTQKFTRQSIDRVKHQNGQGRGLWLGLHLQLDAVDRHPLKPWLPDDAHVTLIHLGRNRPAHEVESIHHVVEDVVYRELVPVEVELTGVGWFWRRNDPTLVALVNSAKIFTCRSAIVRDLTEANGITMSDHFGFIPHVTLRPPSEDWGAKELGRELARVPAMRVHLLPLAVVCGEVTVRPEL